MLCSEVVFFLTTSGSPYVAECTLQQKAKSHYLKGGFIISETIKVY